MPLPIAAMIGAAGSVVGGMLGNSGQNYANRINAENFQLSREDSYQQQRLGMDFSHEEVQQQRQWEEAQTDKSRAWEADMANTEVQRRVKDLQAAGLNPMLGYSSAASTPNVSTPNTSSPQGGSGSPAHAGNAVNPRAGYGRMVEDAINSFSAGQQARRNEAEINLISQQGEKLAADVAETRARTPKYAAEIGEISERTKTYGPQIAHLMSSSALNAAQKEAVEATLPKIVAEIRELYTRSEANKAGAFRSNMEGSLSLDLAQQARAKGALDRLTYEQKQALFPILQQLTQSDAERERLGLPKLRNASQAEESWWKRVVAPYLPDLSSSANSASSAAYIRSVFQ